jgi:hypothetical protein
MCFIDFIHLNRYNVLKDNKHDLASCISKEAY